MPAVEPTTRRQQRLYEDTCDIWQRNALVYTDGKESDDLSYTKIAEDQKFYLFTNSEVSAPHVPGRMGADNLMTLDKAHFPEGVSLNSGDIFKYTTSGSPLINTFWQIMGDPEVKKERTRRKPSLKAVFVKRLKAAPNGVS